MAIVARSTFRTKCGGPAKFRILMQPIDFNTMIFGEYRRG